MTAGRPAPPGGPGPTSPLFAPLTARSVMLSVLLGSHPPELPVRVLVRVADLFGIAEGTARVALSRLAADGDAVSDGGTYGLSPRLLDRQREQDSALRPATRPWRGGWEMAVAHPEQTGAADRSVLGPHLARLRLAELRPGVWVRPDNLVREWPADLTLRALRFSARSEFDQPEPAALAGRLWDLAGWAATAENLMDAMAAGAQPADRFVVAAAIVRHLRADPVLPPALQPAAWPGERLREVYDSFRQELGRLLQNERDRI